MIDVVFLLIIFFLVSAHFVTSEALEPIILPLASQAENPESLQPKHLTITVRADGTYVVAGRERSWEEVEAQLLEAESGRKTEEDQPMEVRIRGDAKATYSRIRPILETCAKAGLSQIQFNVAPELGGAD